MNDSDAGRTLRELTRRVASRLHAQRLLEDAPLAASAALVGWLAARWLPGASAEVLRWGGALVAAAWLGRRSLRRLPALQVAARTDRTAGLADTLLTAEWFLERDDHSDWVVHQRRQAAATAARLDPPGLFPLRIPRARFAAAGLLALLVAAGVGGTGASRAGATALSPDAPQVPDPRADPDGIDPRVPEPPPGADAVRDALPAAADLEALAEALRAGLSEEALERLRELARQAEATRGDGSAEAPGDAAGGEAEAAPMSAEELSRALAEAAAALEQGDAEAAAQALDQAAEAAETREAQRRADAQGSRAASAENPDASQLPMDQDVRWSLDAFSAQAMGAERSQQSARGDAAGPPGASSEPELGAPTDMEVQLEREALSSQSGKETEPIEITEEASREQGSRLGYRGGGGAGRYEPAGAQDAAAVPWADRERVRRYLLALTAEERQR